MKMKMKTENFADNIHDIVDFVHPKNCWHGLNIRVASCHQIIHHIMSYLSSIEVAQTSIFTQKMEWFSEIVSCLDIFEGNSIGPSCRTSSQCQIVFEFPTSKFDISIVVLLSKRPFLETTCCLTKFVALCNSKARKRSFRILK